MSNINHIIYNDITNGTGIRTTIFLSGCPGVIWNKSTKKYEHCSGCFNKQLWNFKHGQEINEDTIKDIVNSLNYKFLEGLSILGGEPLCKENQQSVAQIIKAVRDFYGPSKSIWVWTGYIYTKNPFNKNRIPKTDWTKYILKNINTLIDGPFKPELFNLELQFKGSKNQKLHRLKDV